MNEVDVAAHVVSLLHVENSVIGETLLATYAQGLRETALESTLLTGLLCKIAHLDVVVLAVLRLLLAELLTELAFPLPAVGPVAAKSRVAVAAATSCLVAALVRRRLGGRACMSFGREGEEKSGGRNFGDRR